MRLLILAILLCFSACTRTVAAPAAAPKPTANAAAAIADAFVANAQTKCALWTGRGTPYGGVDSVLCVAPNQLIYVAAPTDGPPVVKVALQLESPPDKKEPPAPGKPEDKKPEPPKPEAKKK